MVEKGQLRSTRQAKKTIIQAIKEGLLFDVNGYK